MSPVLTPGSPWQDTQDQTGTEWFAAVIALGAWTMFFATLVFAAGYLRLRDPWPIAGALVPPRVTLGLGMLLLAGGSAVLHTAHRRLGRVPTARGPTLWSLAGTLLVGVAFLTLQAVVATSLWKAGLRLPSGGAHASSFYGLQAVHALHTLVGMLGLTRLLVHVLRGAEVRQRLRLWNLYWHFVTVTGWLLFSVVYLP
ncbi:MAG TPA: cytochrome c oxidase subunit 3 [Myxococcaceae bacterium]|jgi:cytochrome c oxidase subunit 3